VRDRIAKLLPATVSLPIRSYVGNSREPELAVLDRFVEPGSTVVDIGAHKGIYTYWLRRRVGSGGHVLAYEPQPALYRYLQAGLSSRWYRNVTLSDLALSDHAGTAHLRIPVVSGAEQIAWASLVESGTNDTDGSAGGIDVTVMTARLDDEVRDRPVSFVKCDVEGHELSVLAGAPRLLAQQRPVWLVEVEHRHAGEDVERVLRTFSDAGYQPWYLAASGELVVVPEPQRAAERLNGVEPGRYVNNFFFVP
jgi:FkbM family methyltransferase